MLKAEKVERSMETSKSARLESWRPVGACGQHPGRGTMCLYYCNGPSMGEEDAFETSLRLGLEVDIGFSICSRGKSLDRSRSKRSQAETMESLEVLGLGRGTTRAIFKD